ncbi:predicted protein [Pyrenophora tritici-repentis Pt-1C-BFP]|uniref:Uncharacterized protein n=1 Tax=Pyrenophora tritici-repentis (strain Pt-1C-BFP) TaxID=426418 RepID=B2W5U0_PYRTR|nr:uncharacterized protein PTRG_06098 [Pyrenophora tritici-repentis Pt-1C-BFP]EDU49018.1 predicted protein [Pyrenophora tritici-repentis Pt-1C-BFP]KAI0588887.1 hypothetical protein Alg215_00551 [Pyrenophora tritici-repentis]
MQSPHPSVWKTADVPTSTIRDIAGKQVAIPPKKEIFPVFPIWPTFTRDGVL